MTGFLAGLDDERDALRDRLDALAATWEEVRRATGEPAGPGGLVADDLARLRHDLDQRRFTIGMFGLVKRGKSTLLNALLGTELSPTHVTPETAVPIYVDHGDTTGATVHLASGEQLSVPAGEVAQWTSQRHNAGNHRGVTHVQWSLPSPLLGRGVRFVDTPGLDDAQADELYTRRTIQELEAADAGVLVFMSPPTVGATEMRFLAEVAATDLRRTVLVANLYPQHFHDPEAREDVGAYVRRHVAAVTGQDDVRIHTVCAEEAWQARRFGDEEAFARAGAADLLAAIEDTVAANTGRRVLDRVEAALERTTRMAAAATRLRLQALRAGDDEEQRARVAVDHQALLDDVDDLLERRLLEATGTQAALHARVHQVVLRARTDLQEAPTAAAMDDVLTHARRELEVVTEDAYRILQARLLTAHAEVEARLDDGMAATLHALGGGATGVRAGRRPDHAQGHATPRLAPGAVQGAAVGGLVAGGAGLALVGAALGPVGLVAGAVAGWRLGGVVRRGRELRPLREELDEQLSVVAGEILHGLDHRVDDLVAAVRETSRARRAGFAVDLTATLETQQRCPAGSAARSAAVEALTVLGARLRHDPTVRRPVDLAEHDDAPTLVVSVGEGAVSR